MTKLKRNKNKQSGYTLMELLFVLWFIICLAAMIGMAYVAIHFITKYW